jgi:hypothetical protein
MISTIRDYAIIWIRIGGVAPAITARLTGTSWHDVYCDHLNLLAHLA